MHLLDVRAALGADPPPLGRRLDERAQGLDERVLVHVHDRDLQPERLLRPPDRLVVEERHDRLPERHRLDREHAVPALEDLVDDDVGPLVLLAGLVVVDALDDLQVDRQLRAGLDHVGGALLHAVRGRMDDQRPLAIRRRHGREAAEVDPDRDDVGLRHPARRVVGADDLGAGPLPVGELLRRLAADVGAEVVVERLLPERAQDRELERLRDERQPEVEVEDVELRQQLGERPPLHELAPDEVLGPVERPVGFRVELVALEDDELGVDAAAAQARGRSPTGRPRC